MTDLKPYWQGLDGTIRLYHGHCLDVMATLTDASIDAVVTDPQYGLADLSPATVLQAVTAWVSGDRLYVPDGAGFMGRAWDSFVPPPAVWDECMRILKPGGHVLAFAGSRTVDLATLSLRLAGFEIRDTITWIGSQGFPKSHNVAKAIDRLLGAERPVTAEGDPVKRMIPGASQNRTGSWIKDDGRTFTPQVTESATPEAKQWDGWGTALKPASEPIIVGRKPLTRTIAANVLEHGTGALNIDACRVDGAPRPARTNEGSASGLTGTGGASTYGSFAVRGSISIGETTEGRWPPNVVFSHADGCRPAGTRTVKAGTHVGRNRDPTEIGNEIYRGRRKDARDGGYAGADGLETVTAWACVPGCPVGELDAQAGPRTSGANPERRSADKFRDAYGAFKGEQACIPARGADAGAASRFFPVFHPGDDGEPPRHAGGCRPVVASDSNGCVPGCPVAELDAQSGARRSAYPGDPQAAATYAGTECGDGDRAVYSPGLGRASASYADEGTASRFFPAFRYEPKAGPDERPRLADGTAHVAVKPLELMKWLVRLVVPQGAVVLDPFAGTGTTGRACAVEGMDAILIEQDEGHCQLAVLKLSKPVQQALFPDLGLA